jgi:hypothetical protein
MRIVLLVCLLVAASCGSRLASTEGLHQDCSGDGRGDARVCAGGQECMGHAGLDGRTRYSCEIPCAQAEDCPEGFSCLVAAGEGAESRCF